MQASREQQASLVRALLDDAREGLVALDENGAILDLNRAAAEYFGAGRVSLVGKPFVNFVPLATRRAFRTAIGRVKLDEPVQLDLALGELGTPMTLRLRLIPGLKQRVIALTVTSEVDGDLPAAPAAAPAEQRLERLFLRFPYAAIGIRADLRVAWANNHARRLLGRDAVRKGEPLPPRPGLDLRAVAERLVSVPAPLIPNEVEDEDGRVLRISGVAAHGDDPAVLFLEDVTTKHRHDRTMREFVRNAAHQLRTPLAGITSAVEILQSGAKESPADRDRFLEHVETHAERLTRLTRGLLVLARAQSGESARLDFVDVLPLLESLAASATPAADVAIQVSCPASLAALAEPDLLREALWAMVDNAVAHTHEGVIWLRAFDADGHVTIQVVDAGAGILPEHQGRIFEPFFRVEGSGRGFGLGLAIAAQAVDAMDGELVVMGDPGGGTTFSIRLPSGRLVQ